MDCVLLVNIRGQDSVLGRLTYPNQPFLTETLVEAQLIARSPRKVAIENARWFHDRQQQTPAPNQEGINHRVFQC